MSDDIVIYNIPYSEFTDILIKQSKGLKVDNALFMSRYQTRYFSIDNEKGQFLCEDFSSKDKALCWLLRKDYSADEIKKMPNINARKLIKDINHQIIGEEKEYGLS